MQQLFDLPDSSKAKLDANLSPLHRGYTGLGGAHNCVPDETTVKGPDNKESYLFGKWHALAAAEAEEEPVLVHTQVLCIHQQQQQQQQKCPAAAVTKARSCRKMGVD
jgi:isopenicillin N synthase-like dioxygenase